MFYVSVCHGLVTKTDRTAQKRAIQHTGPILGQFMYYYNDIHEMPYCMQSAPSPRSMKGKEELLSLDLEDSDYLLGHLPCPCLGLSLYFVIFDTTSFRILKLYPYIQHSINDLDVTNQCVPVYRDVLSRALFMLSTYACSSCNYKVR